MTPTAPAAGAPAHAACPGHDPGLPASLKGRPVLGLFRHGVGTPGLAEGWTVLLGPAGEGGDPVVATWTPTDPGGWIQGAYFGHPADAAVEFARRLRALGPAAEAIREGDARPVLAIVRGEHGVRAVSDDPDRLDDQRVLFVEHGWASAGGAPMTLVRPLDIGLCDHDLDALHERARAEGSSATCVVEPEAAP